MIESWTAAITANGGMAVGVGLRDHVRIEGERCLHAALALAVHLRGGSEPQPGAQLLDSPPVWA
jgi:hypothetical protein